MMLSITEAAHQLAVHPDTLRRIERTFAFTPRRTRAGARRYTAEDIEALRPVLHPETSAPPTDAEVDRG